MSEGWSAIIVDDPKGSNNNDAGVRKNSVYISEFFGANTNVSRCTHLSYHNKPIITREFHILSDVDAGNIFWGWFIQCEEIHRDRIDVELIDKLRDFVDG